MSEMGMAMMGSGKSTGANRAREAAEAAIRSPLLEDVNLQGAKGILVNITAGMDLALGEFTEVGEVIDEFASGDATVVVGTVIDPEMTDELRVTVVATGLGDAIRMREPAPTKVVVDNTRMADGKPNYAALNKPTVMRASKLASGSARPATAHEQDLEYLDIPAFLRKQAD
jgi:cell division protein FtsZ